MTFLKHSYGVLLQANVYGFFTGAWTALYIDFNLFSMILTLIWGYIVGRAWFHFKNYPNILSGITYVFSIYSIFISFVSSPFGFSNSFMIFFWLIPFCFSSFILNRYAIRN